MSGTVNIVGVGLASTTNYTDVTTETSGVVGTLGQKYNFS